MKPAFSNQVPSTPALSVALLALAMFVGSSDARAQAVLNPNQITGTVGFTNENPAVLNILSSSGLGQGMNSVHVRADSIGVDPSLNNYTRPASSNGIDTSYSLTVEASDEGISYQIRADLYLGGTTAYYRMAPRESSPVHPEPAADVTMDLLECAGIVDVRWVDALGEPIEVQGGYIQASKPDFAYQAYDWRISRNVSQEYLAVHGDGSTYAVEVVYEFGTSVYSDTVRGVCKESMPVACDEIVTMTCVLDGATQLGEIAGVLDMLGEDEHYIGGQSRVMAFAGPLRNQRYHTIAGTPSQGEFVLGNLVPSDAEDPARGYQVHADMVFRKGHRAEMFRTPRLYNNKDYGSNISVMVAAGQTTQIGDTFVIDPGYVSGSIRLAGPSMNPGDSCLQDLYRDGDYDTNGDGIPNNHWITSSYIEARGLSAVAPGAIHNAVGGSARVGFEGSFDLSTGEFNGDYELVLGGLHGEASVWKPNVLNLRMSDSDTASESFQNSWFRIYDQQMENHVIVPEQSLTTDRAYCMSQIQLSYHALSGTFSDPQARIRGDFAGLDFEGNESTYSTSGWAYGTPRGSAAAASDGMVTMCLPQGEFTLTPTVTSQNPGGGTSNTELRPVTISVGCGQEIVATTDLQVSLDEMPQITGDATITLSGHVNSDGDVMELGFQHNDHFEVLLCTSCGVDPEFSAEIELAAGQNSIRIWALDEFGNEASVDTVVSHQPPPVLAGCDDIEVDLEEEHDAVVVEFDVYVAEGHSSTVLSCDPASGSEFEAGEQTVTCVAEDSFGGRDECEFQIIVNGTSNEPVVPIEPIETEVPDDCEVDVTAPVVECSVGAERLWPPNHRFVDVGLEVTTEDECDSGESSALQDSVSISVWSDEPEVSEPGDGSGHFAPDAAFSSALLLRSERRGTEDGRVYLAIAEAEDAAGNLGIACCTVVVSHDRSRESRHWVMDQADEARAYCEEFGAPPPYYTEHGISEIMGHKQPPTDEELQEEPDSHKKKKNKKGKKKGNSRRRGGKGRGHR